MDKKKQIKDHLGPLPIIIDDVQEFNDYVEKVRKEKQEKKGENKDE